MFNNHNVLRMMEDRLNHYIMIQLHYFPVTKKDRQLSKSENRRKLVMIMMKAQRKIHLHEQDFEYLEYAFTQIVVHQLLFLPSS